MFHASFFAASPAPSDSDVLVPGQSITMTIATKAAKSSADAAHAFAEGHGLALSDLGRRETSSRFKRIESFGIEGHTQRLFVWADR